jgi:hypothetical protein
MGGVSNSFFQVRAVLETFYCCRFCVFLKRRVLILDSGLWTLDSGFRITRRFSADSASPNQLYKRVHLVGGEGEGEVGRASSERSMRQ